MKASQGQDCEEEVRDRYEGRPVLKYLRNEFLSGEEQERVEEEDDRELEERKRRKNAIEKIEESVEKLHRLFGELAQILADQNVLVEQALIGLGSAVAGDVALEAAAGPADMQALALPAHCGEEDLGETAQPDWNCVLVQQRLCLSAELERAEQATSMDRSEMGLLEIPDFEEEEPMPGWVGHWGGKIPGREKGELRVFNK